MEQSAAASQDDREKKGSKTGHEPNHERKFNRNRLDSLRICV
jgi:hypothetical protein